MMVNFMKTIQKMWSLALVSVIATGAHASGHEIENTEIKTTSVSALSEGEIRINVSGIKKVKGQITCSIYNDPNTFLKRGVKAMRKVVEAPSKDGVTCIFKDVTPGEYAITVTHDKNANNKMDNNFLGIPREPWGVSNNARPTFRAPRWEEAVFAFEGETIEMNVKVD